MKLSRFFSKASTSLSSQSPPFPKLSFGSTSYSTQTQKPIIESQPNNRLYRRISQVGDPDKSIVPILNQWVHEGRPVTQDELRNIIRELRHYRRFKHALEISQWMSDKRYMHLLAADVAIRLHLIAKVHGIEEAENYFNNTSNQMRTAQVYSALLNCYAHAKCEDKAEAVMHKMKEFGFSVKIINYNGMLNLYRQTGNHEKFVALFHEMEVKQIKFDIITYSILLNAPGANSDVGEIEKVLARIESDADLKLNWSIYADVANQFLRVGFVDKATELLKKSEKLVASEKRKKEAFSYLLTLYATAGKKNEVLRMWNNCKRFKLCNREYICILSSMLKFGDIATAENIFKDWKANIIQKDIRVANLLMGFYCRQGLIEKAEAILYTFGKPSASTWYWMSLGYFRRNQMIKGVEAMESALQKHDPGSRWKPHKESIIACLKYLKEEGNADRSGDFVGLLKEKGLISEEIHQQLLAYFSGEYALEDGLPSNILGGNEDYVEAIN